MAGTNAMGTGEKRPSQQEIAAAQNENNRKGFDRSNFERQLHDAAQAGDKNALIGLAEYARTHATPEYFNEINQTIGRAVSGSDQKSIEGDYINQFDRALSSGDFAAAQRITEEASKNANLRPDQSSALNERFNTAIVKAKDDALLNKMTGQAQQYNKAFEQGQPQYQGRQGVESELRRGLASQLAEQNQQAARRGLLGSGVAQSARGEAVGLLGQKSNINAQMQNEIAQGYKDAYNQMATQEWMKKSDTVMQEAMAKQQDAISRYNQNLAGIQDKQKAVGALAGTVGQGMGTVGGMMAAQKTPEQTTGAKYDPSNPYGKNAVDPDTLNTDALRQPKFGSTYGQQQNQFQFGSS